MIARHAEEFCTLLLYCEVLALGLSLYHHTYCWTAQHSTTVILSCMTGAARASVTCDLPSSNIIKSCGTKRPHHTFRTPVEQVSKLSLSDSTRPGWCIGAAREHAELIRGKEVTAVYAERGGYITSTTLVHQEGGVPTYLIDVLYSYVSMEIIY